MEPVTVGSIPTMEPVPVQPVLTCPIKWDYKAVESFRVGKTGFTRKIVALEGNFDHEITVIVTYFM